MLANFCRAQNASPQPPAEDTAEPMQSELNSELKTDDVRVQSELEPQEPTVSQGKTPAGQQPTKQQESAAIVGKDTDDSRKVSVPGNEPSPTEDEAQAMQTDAP